MSATCSESCEPLAAPRRLAGHVLSHCSNQIPPNSPPPSSENYSFWHTFDDCGMARVLLCFSKTRCGDNGDLPLVAFPSTARRLETRSMRRRQMYYAIRGQGPLGPSGQARFDGPGIKQQEAGATLLQGTM